jgi:excisionase family DNA binding protein
MSEQLKPLFVRLASVDSERLDAAVLTTGKSKRQLVSEAVRSRLSEGDINLDRTSLTVGRIALREPAPEVLTLGEAAELLRLSPEQLESAAASGELPGRRIAGEWRFSQSALISWLGSGAAPDRA